MSTSVPPLSITRHIKFSPSTSRSVYLTLYLSRSTYPSINELQTPAVHIHDEYVTLVVLITTTKRKETDNAHSGGSLEPVPARPDSPATPGIPDHAQIMENMTEGTKRGSSLTWNQNSSKAYERGAYLTGSLSMNP